MVLLAGMMPQTATSTPQYVPFNTSLHAQSTMLACCEIPHENKCGLQATSTTLQLQPVLQSTFQVLLLVTRTACDSDTPTQVVVA